MRKIIQISITIFLFGFSFYYTNQLVKIIRNSDPIMKMIEVSEDIYEIKSVNSIIDNDTIEIGLNGIVVNSGESFTNMKRYGSFNSSLIIYDEVKPEISMTKYIDKYVIGSVTKEHEISLLLEVKDLDIIDEILSILEDRKIEVTFLIKDSDIIKNNEIMKKISSNHTITSTNYSNKVLNELLLLNKNNLPYCFVQYKDDRVKDTCKNNNMYTVLPTIITKSQAFSNVKKELDGGKVISISVSKDNIEELIIILNYIKQKGYKIIPIYKLLSENYFNQVYKTD